jgi:hypothetical protein
MKEEIKSMNLKPTDGDCIVEYQYGEIISLLCVENFVDGSKNVKTRVCTKSIVPTDVGSPFWKLVRELAIAQGLSEVVTALDDVMEIK